MAKIALYDTITNNKNLLELFSGIKIQCAEDTEDACYTISKYLRGYSEKRCLHLLNGIRAGLI